MLNIQPGNNPLFALSCLLQGAKLLNHPQLRKYLLIPLFINIVLYSGAFVLGYHSVSALIHEFIPDWLSWLNWILWPLFFISFLVVGFFTFTLLANLIAAPYYSALSAKVLQLIGEPEAPIVEQAWDTVFVGELKRLGYLAARMVPLLVLFMIPVVNLLAPLLWALFAGWGVAMEYMAYPLESRGMAFPAQKQFLRRSIWSALSFGGVTSLGLTLPVVNLFIGQAAVIGATIYVQRLAEAGLSDFPVGPARMKD
ncbi:sulfate transporter CysZ [Methylomonas sp. SURF-2]|uniref:Sulfate transporter CysZ n=1 Tax=Methylomonas subterranea TaxID=2952225 RepID=A0ABT1TJA5_9GAMM|nr:sulfate transporter CysZ [Methylomonas sp. SURF-2]MCQ8105565.1 sulfate transporter CysZ [Methylomonas sp. SURF-2]